MGGGGDANFLPLIYKRNAPAKKLKIQLKRRCTEKRNLCMGPDVASTKRARRSGARQQRDDQFSTLTDVVWRPLSLAFPARVPLAALLPLTRFPLFSDFVAVCVAYSTSSGPAIDIWICSRVRTMWWSPFQQLATEISCPTSGHHSFIWLLWSVSRWLYYPRR